MDRRELADFLRSRRARVGPADMGLPAGTRRRTPGLRREEVAHLAFISTEYYARLEQARGPRPSHEVLSGLARALRLDDAEREHLHLLAGAPAPQRGRVPREVRPSIHNLLQRLPGTAAIVVSASFEVLAWNHLATALLEDFSALSRRDRNLLRRAFLGPHAHGQRLYGVSDADEFARAAVGRLRGGLARYPSDPDLAELVRDLLAGSAEFTQLWAAHDVATQPVLRKTFLHRLVGPVTVDCDVLELTDQGQQVVLYTASPGSAAEQALQLLAVLGTQRLTDAP